LERISLRLNLLFVIKEKFSRKFKLKEKAKFSHRLEALKKALPILEKLFQINQ